MVIFCPDFLRARFIPSKTFVYLNYDYTTRKVWPLYGCWGVQKVTQYQLFCL